MSRMRGRGVRVGGAEPAMGVEEVLRWLDWRVVMVVVLVGTCIVGASCFLTVLTVQYFTLPLDLLRGEKSVEMLRSSVGARLPRPSRPKPLWPKADDDERPSQPDDGLLEVFVVPHSHCDPGWLMSFEQYYQQQVRRILDNVVYSLEENEQRRFVWAEISFFKLWWDEQPESKRERFRALVRREQVEFVEGGWVQNDEANPDPLAVVEQLTEGHQWLQRTFGVRPRVGWQIDPFGHSSLTPTLLAQAGMDALVINRIHYRLKAHFKQFQHMEFVWRGSAGLGERSELFTHVLHTHYSAPENFDFEDRSPPSSLSGPSFGHLVQELVAKLRQRASSYRTRRLLVLLGDDFKFQNAQAQFGTWDALIAAVNDQDQAHGMRLRYATASEYFDALRALGSNASFPLYHDDFFPYADNADSYWTGYYSTRPAMKFATRDTQAYVRAADLLLALSRPLLPDLDSVQLFDDLEAARRDVALFQHHDGITGTAKSFVVGDYKSRLDRAKLLARGALSEVVASLLHTHLQPHALVPGRTVVLSHRDAPRYVLPQEVTFGIEESGEDSKPVILSVVNPLGWARDEVVRVLVRTAHPERLEVRGSGEVALTAQVDDVLDEAGDAEPGLYYVYFSAHVGPLSARAFALVQRAERSEHTARSTVKLVRRSEVVGKGHYAVENGVLRLELSSETGLLRTIRHVDGRWLRCEQSYLEFETQRSGAYLFRSDGRRAVPVLAHEWRAHIQSGPLVQTAEVHMHFGGAQSRDEIRTTYKLYPADGSAGFADLARLVEVVHDVSVSANRELIVRYESSVQSGNFLYTDNGLELVRRNVRHRPIVEPDRQEADEARFYPVVSTALLRDVQDHDLQVAVLAKQSMGGSSHKPGGLEFMLHRHLAADDQRGLGEAVADLSRVHVVQWLLWGAPADVEAYRPQLVQRLNLPFILTASFLDSSSSSSSSSSFSSLKNNNNSMSTLRFSSQEKEDEKNSSLETSPSLSSPWTTFFSPLKASLPPNVHLFTLRARDRFSDDVLLRLTHLYDADDHAAELPPDMRQTELLDLLHLFADPLVLSLPRQTTLTHTHEYSLLRYQFDASVGVLSSSPSALSDEPVGSRQNTLEDGVFISQAAVDDAKKRKLMRAQEQRPFDEDPTPGQDVAENEDSDAASSEGWDGANHALDELFALDLAPLETRAVVVALSSRTGGGSLPTSGNWTDRPPRAVPLSWDSVAQPRGGLRNLNDAVLKHRNSIAGIFGLLGIAVCALLGAISLCTIFLVWNQRKSSASSSHLRKSNVHKVV